MEQEWTWRGLSVPPVTTSLPCKKLITKFEAAARAALREDSVLVVVGGDGMVHLGAQLAREKNVPLGVIPAGTGNDLARHLGLPLGSISQATEHLITAMGEILAKSIWGLRSRRRVSSIPLRVFSPPDSMPS